MKKLLLVGAIMLGAATASQAGVRFHLGLPLPPLPVPGVVVTPPVYSEPYCPPAYDYAPGVVVEPYYYGYGYGYYPYRHHYYGPRYYGHRYYGGHYGGHYYGGHGHHGRW